MFNNIKQTYKPFKLQILAVLMISITLGIYPIFCAEYVASLIDQTTSKDYIIYSLLITTQTLISRVQEYILQNLQANILPKLQKKYRSHNPQDPITIENSNKIATFLSNFWGPCFFLKSFTLVIGAFYFMAKTKSNILITWCFAISSIILISIIWQPKTYEKNQDKFIVNNKFLKNSSESMLNSVIKANQNVNNIIFKQQFFKTIIISSIIYIITYLNWLELANHKISIGTTIMTLNISISTTELIWWIQHEFSFWKLQTQNFIQALKNLKQT